MRQVFVAGPYDVLLFWRVRQTSGGGPVVEFDIALIIQGLPVVVCESERSYDDGWTKIYRALSGDIRVTLEMVPASCLRQSDIGILEEVPSVCVCLNCPDWPGPLKLYQIYGNDPDQTPDKYAMWALAQVIVHGCAPLALGVLADEEE